MVRLDKYIRGISHNPKGARRLTPEDKKKLKEEYRKRTGKKTPDKLLEIDHKKPIAIYRKAPIFDLMNQGRIDVNTASGRSPKHAYDRKNNLQVLHRKTHRRIKTPQDNRNIRKKRRQELEEWGLGKIDFGI